MDNFTDMMNETLLVEKEIFRPASNLDVVARAEQHPDRGTPYKSLNDKFPVGFVKVWYFKPEFARDMLMGYEWLQERGMLPDPNNLEKMHVLLGSVAHPEAEYDIRDYLYGELQGERWSPHGEARDLIRSKGLAHTSMSVGDIIEDSGYVWMCDSVDWVDLKSLEHRDG
jgi:hypothetical protein